MTNSLTPKVRLELLDLIALPSLTVDEFKQKSSAWTFDTDGALDVCKLLQDTDFNASDLFLIELIADEANERDISDAVGIEGYQMTDVRDALQVLACGFFADRQPFPFICRPDFSAGHGSIYVQMEETNRVSIFSAQKAGLARDSQHHFLLARRQRFAPS